MRSLEKTTINREIVHGKISHKNRRMSDNISLFSSFSSSFSSSLSSTCNTVKEIFKKEKSNFGSKKSSTKRNRKNVTLHSFSKNSYTDIPSEHFKLCDETNGVEKQSGLFKNLKIGEIFKRNKSLNQKMFKSTSKKVEYSKFIRDSKKGEGKLSCKKNSINKFQKLYNSLILNNSKGVEEFNNLAKIISPPDTPRSRYAFDKYVYRNNSINNEYESFVQSCNFEMKPSIRRRSLYTKNKNARFGRSMPLKHPSLSTIHEDYEQVLMHCPVSDEEDDSDYYDDYVDLGGSEIHYF
uniref:Uncharacterized protein n=1 Tax=Strongyloides venezuelensis TaxID=75913 RepID=A0A0K0FAE2_STRVS